MAESWKFCLGFFFFFFHFKYIKLVQVLMAHIHFWIPFSPHTYSPKKIKHLLNVNLPHLDNWTSCNNSDFWFQVGGVKKFSCFPNIEVWGGVLLIWIKNFQILFFLPFVAKKKKRKKGGHFLSLGFWCWEFNVQYFGQHIFQPSFKWICFNVLLSLFYKYFGLVLRLVSSSSATLKFTILLTSQIPCLILVQHFCYIGSSK